MARRSAPQGVPAGLHYRDLCQPCFVILKFTNTLEPEVPDSTRPKNVFIEYNLFYFFGDGDYQYRKVDSRFFNGMNVPSTVSTRRPIFDENYKREIIESCDKIEIIKTGPWDEAVYSTQYCGGVEPRQLTLRNTSLNQVKWHFWDGSYEIDNLWNFQPDGHPGMHVTKTSLSSKLNLKMVQVTYMIEMKSFYAPLYKEIRQPVEDDVWDDDWVPKPCVDNGHKIVNRLDLDYHSLKGMLTKYLSTMDNDEYNMWCSSTSLRYVVELGTKSRSKTPAAIDIKTVSNNPTEIYCRRYYDLTEGQLKLNVIYDINAMELRIPNRNDSYFGSLSPTDVNIRTDFEDGLVKLTFETKFDFSPTDWSEIDTAREVLFYHRTMNFNLYEFDAWYENEDTRKHAKVQQTLSNATETLANELELKLAPLKDAPRKNTKIVIIEQFFCKMKISSATDPSLAQNDNSEDYWLFIPLNGISNWTVMDSENRTWVKDNHNFIYEKKNPSSEDSQLMHQTDEIIRKIDYKCYGVTKNDAQTGNVKTKLHHHITILSNSEYIRPQNRNRVLENGTIELHLVLENTPNVWHDANCTYYGADVKDTGNQLKNQMMKDADRCNRFKNSNRGGIESGRPYKTVDLTIEEILKDLPFNDDIKYNLHVHCNRQKDYCDLSSLDMVAENEFSAEDLWRDPSVFDNNGVFDAEQAVSAICRNSVNGLTRREIIIISHPFDGVDDIKSRYTDGHTRVQHMFIGLGGQFMSRDRFDTNKNQDCWDISDWETFNRRLKRKIAIAFDPSLREFLSLDKIKPKQSPIEPTLPRFIKNCVDRSLYWTCDEMRNSQKYDQRQVFKFIARNEIEGKPATSTIRFDVVLKNQKFQHPEPYEDELNDQTVSANVTYDANCAHKNLECLRHLDKDNFLFPLPMIPSPVIDQQQGGLTAQQRRLQSGHMDVSIENNRKDLSIMLAEIKSFVKISGSVDITNFDNASEDFKRCFRKKIREQVQN